MSGQLRVTVTAKDFNAWMDDYVNHPERFVRDWKIAVQDHLREKAKGEPESYGAECIAYLKHSQAR